ncbi:MAG: hypothetical protein DRI01_09365 [Chloroflexi bacterium]|nr:MAG: hypothetical protein DRI01_09365 [Chloroflexota bacterium]
MNDPYGNSVVSYYPDFKDGKSEFQDLLYFQESDDIRGSDVDFSSTSRFGARQGVYGIMTNSHALPSYMSPVVVNSRADATSYFDKSIDDVTVYNKSCRVGIDTYFDMNIAIPFFKSLLQDAFVRYMGTMYWAWGSYTTNSVSKYISIAKPYGGSHSQIFHGGVCNSINISGSEMYNVIRMTSSFMFSDRSFTSVPRAVVYEDDNIYKFLSASPSMYISNTPYPDIQVPINLLGFDITFTNNLKPHYRYTDYISAYELGRFSITGSISIGWDQRSEQVFKSNVHEYRNSGTPMKLGISWGASGSNGYLSMQIQFFVTNVQETYIGGELALIINFRGTDQFNIMFVDTTIDRGY